MDVDEEWKDDWNWKKSLILFIYLNGLRSDCSMYPRDQSQWAFQYEVLKLRVYEE